MSNWEQKTKATQQGQQQLGTSLPNALRRTDLDGQVLEIIGDTTATLRWSEDLGELSILSGGSNYSVLTLLKGSILKLWRQFFQSDIGKQLTKDQLQFFHRRLISLQRQVDGLLKRKIHFSVKDVNGGQRSLDYTGLLNEKQVQIIQLEKKIQNLQERLRRASQREKDLEGEIERLRAAMIKIQKPNVSRADIQSLLRGSSDYKALELKYNSLRQRFSGFGGLIRAHSDKLRASGTGISLDFEGDLNSLIKSEGINVSLVSGVATIIDYKDRVVEVPVSDSRTKHLIHLLAVQMKKFFLKYPKLREQCDVRLTQFFQQQLIDIIEVDEIDRIVQIVKYVPDIYRVQNVYAYSSQKSRKVQFHLRVLLKALLEEFEKLKRKIGLVLDIDQGVIGMINAEIMDVVNVDDILKVFRVVPKIVEVQKIVEKIVDRVIQIPQVVPVEKIVQKIIERPQIIEVQKIIHVPVQIIKYIDVHHDKIVTVQKETQRIVEVPRIVEKVVERIIQIPKVVTQQLIVEKVIQVERPTIIEKIIHVPVVEIQLVEVIRQKVITVEKVVQRVVQVPVFVQKIVVIKEQIPQLVTVDKRNDILVKQIEIQNAREVVNHIQRVPEIVEIIHQKPIPLIQTVQRIVEVPKIIEKIVQVRVEIPTIKQVKVVQQKIVYKDKIKQVERIVTKTVQVIRQVQKIVERNIEVPIIVERIVRVPQIITQIAVERINNPVIVEVEKYVQKIVQVPKIIQVEIVKTIEVTVDNPVKITVQKIVEVPKIIERIKQVRVNIDKIIQKMVEVPKVVQVQKIVEKIIVVPRVIQKVVEVPQIVEKVVDRIIENTKVIEVEKIIQVPMFQDRVKIVEVPVNTYITQKQIVETKVEKIVPVVQVVTNIEVIKQINDKIIEHRVQVPKELYVDRIVPLAHEVTKVVQIEKQIIVPVEIPIPIDRVIEKVIPIERDVQKIVQCPQTIEKIVEIKVESIQVQKVVELISVPVFTQQIREIQKIVPYIQTEIKQVKLIEQKVILQTVEVQKIVQVERFIERLNNITHQIIKAQEVQKLVDKIVEVPKLVTVENFVPVLVEVNRLVEVYRDREIHIPLIHQQIKQVQVIEEKVVAIENKNTQIKQVVTNHDRIIEQEKLITKTDVVNQIDIQIKTIDRYEDRIVPITTSIEKIIEVPYILEKIVQKIVIMPQVVEVLKYVHQIVEQQTLGVAVGVDIYTQQAKYKGLYGKLKIQFEALLVQLRRMRSTNPALKVQIEMIQAFLIELDKLIAFPRIVQVEKEKLVEVSKNVPVLVPTLDVQTERFQVTLSLIIGKLLDQLMSIRNANPNVKFNIDTQILKIFSNQYRDKVGLLQKGEGNFDEKLHNIYKLYDTFLKNLGGSKLSWQQQLMYTAALQERLLISSLIEDANLQISKALAISDKRAEAYRMIRQTYEEFRAKFQKSQKKFDDLGIQDSAVRDLLRQLTEEIHLGYANIERFATAEPFANGVKRQLYEFNDQNLPSFSQLVIQNPHFSMLHHNLNDYKGITDGNFEFEPIIRARLQALYKENDLLRDKYIRWQRQSPNIHGVEDRDRIIDTLEKKIVELSSQLNTCKGQTSVNVNVVGNTQQYQLKIRTLNSKNQQLESQLRTLKLDSDSKLKAKDRQIQQKDKQIQSLQEKLKIGDSRATGFANSQYTPSSKTSLGQDRMSTSGYSGTSGSESGYGNYSSAGGRSATTSGIGSTPTYGSTGYTGATVNPTTTSGAYNSTGSTPSTATYGQIGNPTNSGSRYGQTGQPLSGTGASYGPTGTSTLSGSGASYGQTGTQSTSTPSAYVQRPGSVSGVSNLSGSGVLYGQSGSSQLSGSGASYGQPGSSQLSGSGASLNQSGINSNLGPVGGSTYNTTGYLRNYGPGTTSGLSGTGGVSANVTGGINSSYGTTSGSSTGGFSTTSGTTGTTGMTGTTPAKTYGTSGTSGSSYTRYNQN